VPDLARLGTTIDLAVLSACDSGRGPRGAGGDVVGLTRSLLTVGVRQLVVSLWPVDDVLACLTMVGLHRELLAGRPPSAALATAQRELRMLSVAEAGYRYRQLCSETGMEPPRGRPTEAGDSHPFFWAPFVHVGG
jgi:CHAT domain-containing protein